VASVRADCISRIVRGRKACRTCGRLKLILAHMSLLETMGREDNDDDERENEEEDDNDDNVFYSTTERVWNDTYRET
jgi:hypothetical protein